MTELTPADVTTMAEATAPPATEAGGVTQSCPRTKLRIGIFFDGTWNNATNAQRGLDARAVGLETFTGSWATSITHPAHLQRIYARQLGNDIRDDDGVVQKIDSIYVEGIGTTTGYADDNIGGATAFFVEGINTRIYRAASELHQKIMSLSPACDPELIEIDLFGFSRGAATARIFANLIKGSDHPLLAAAEIRFMGLFDTVAALGIAWQEWDDAAYGLNYHVGAQTADMVVHLTAAHEIRENFSLNSIDPSLSATRVQLALPGVHGTIGGSPLDEVETVTIGPHEFSLMQAQGLLQGSLDPDQLFTQRTYESDLFNNTRQNPGTRTYRDLQLTVFPGLRILSLEVMYEKAVAAGVPFGPLNPAMPLPARFAPLKAAALANRPITPEMMQVATNSIIPSARYWSLNDPDSGLRRTIVPNRPGEAE